MNVASAIRRHPLVSYFALAYGASFIALLVIGLPSLRNAPQRWSAAPLVMFPVMVVAVGLAGLGLTAVVDGRAAAKRLLRSVTKRAAPRRYYAALLIPPCAILIALVVLRLSPNLFPVGVFFGLLAGFFEELGWSGFAYPRMRARLGAAPAAIVLGVLWGLWHFPVVDSLGVAHPHGRAWPLFFAAFLLILTALRVLIAWVYTATGSIQLAQLMHASSTGFLVVFGAAHVSPRQEAAWYALYGALLTAVAIVVIALRLSRHGSAASGLVQPQWARSPMAPNNRSIRDPRLRGHGPADPDRPGRAALGGLDRALADGRGARGRLSR